MRMIEAITEIAEIVQELNPGKDMERVKHALAEARKHATDSTFE